MPNLWDKTPETPSPSELNPLTNPLLEQNLGRWAKVYFSNPPAKRDQAVSQSSGRDQAGIGCVPGCRTWSTLFCNATRIIQRAVCSACQHQNPPGHKFCSRCGEALDPEQAASSGSSGTSARRESPKPLPPESANDAQWLRDQAFSGLDGIRCSAKTSDGNISSGAARDCAGWFCVSAVGFGPRQSAADPSTPQMSAPAQRSRRKILRQPKPRVRRKRSRQTTAPESTAAVQNTPSASRTRLRSGNA